MILINFSHPLTEQQLAQIATFVGATPEVRAIDAQIDRERPLAEVAVELVDRVGLSPDEWQTIPLLINPPALAPLAVAVLAEIHGRAGGFPAMVNVRPVTGTVPTRYEVAEVLNLQALREAARRRR
ncbi:CRISPR-associated protein Csx15 [Roseiflexus sp.]|uniref:CRISPR-associated protein Csx15 n=1 Tax=Roseiflexus sp. TaxID=2562120 RepID=UPI0021DE6130|nr:CRISPR-associated protein Csx15 [Roseiflexus sp.]GIW01734.1 MAG: hypothetical protein KatS3mg058_3137 [Roseiflexus sp.]